MSEASGPNRTVVTLIALITVVAISAVAGFILLRGGSQSEVNAHRGQWAERSFNAYEIEIETTSLIQCQLKYQVRDEQVVPRPVSGGTHNCIQYTISELFDVIEQSGGGCGPNGCACDGPIGTDVTYDDQLGYPTRIETRMFPEKRFMYPEFWKKQVLGGGCTLVGFVGSIIEVISLTPLP